MNISFTTSKAVATSEAGTSKIVNTNKVGNSNGKLVAASREPVEANVEKAATKIATSVTNTHTAETPTESDEDIKPKLPLWKAALKQRKEAEAKKKDEEEKRLVSNYFMPKILLLHILARRGSKKMGRSTTLEKKVISQKRSRQVLKFFLSLNPPVVIPLFFRQKVHEKEMEIEQLKEQRDAIFQALPKWKQELILKQQEDQP